MVRVACVGLGLSLFACEVQVAPADTCGGEVCAVDQRCNEGAQRCVADEAPTLSLSGPTGVVTTARFTVRGTARDDVAVTQFEWSLDDGPWQPLSAQPDSSFALELDAPSVDAVALVVKVRAGDGKQTTQKEVSVTVDRVAPQVTVKAPAAGVVQKSSRVPFVFSVTDGSGALRSLTVGSTVVAAPTVGDTAVSVDLMGGDLEERLVQYEAIDANGNTTTNTARVTIDDTTPAPVFVTPVVQPTVTNDAALRVKVQAMDRSSIARVLLAQVDGGQVEASQDDAGVWSADFLLPAAEGSMQFQAEAVDTHGNRGTAVSSVQPFDRLAPQLALLGPDAGTTFNAAFLVRAQTNADAVSVEAQFGGATVQLSEGAGDVWQGSVPLMLTGDAVSSPLVLTARDAVGNVTTVSSSLLVDTVAPRITFTTPAAGAKLNATQFPGGNGVQVQWTVQDGDPRAGTRTVNGQASSANQFAVTTSPTDNGRDYTVTVVARDQLNETTASLNFTVDRVLPTVTSWTPVEEARNIDPRETHITFSEPVYLGTDSQAPALSLSGAAGSWDVQHRTWSATGLQPYTVYSAQLPGLSDLSGNPLVRVPDRRFHTSAVVPTSGTVVAQGVTSFKAVADQDGVVTLGLVKPTGFAVHRLSPVTGALEPPLYSGSAPNSYELSAFAVIEAASLAALNRAAVTVVRGPSLEQLLLSGFGPGVAPAPTTGATGVVLTMPALNGEPGTRAYGLITASQYERGGAETTLVHRPSTVAQSPTDWVAAGFDQMAFAVQWSRFTCYLAGATYACEALPFSANVTSATEVGATLSASGHCLVVSWTISAARRGVFQGLQSCARASPVALAPPTCEGGAPFSPQSLPTGFRVAPFSANGEATLIAAYDDGGWRLAKLSSPTACSVTSFTDIGAALSDTVTAAAPIQVGNKAALLYIDGASNLKLYVP